MIKGIGAIPHNLIIKSGGYTYYPLNQFEIDGTVAVELYRQDSEGNKSKLFSFKGEKDELKKFKTKFPTISQKEKIYHVDRGWHTIEKSESIMLYKLAENLSAEAAAFNNKIFSFLTQFKREPCGKT